jgi:hypothetical protein
MKKYIWMFFGAALVVVIILVIIMREEGALKSPKETQALNDGDLKVEIVYSRPSKKGRDIFGALVPYDKIWRTGANEASEFHTNKSLSFNGQTLPSGTYSIWSQPGPNTWKIIFNSTIPNWGINDEGVADRNPDTDFIVVDVASEIVAETAELFTMKLEKANTGYTMMISWDNTKVTVPFTRQ